MLMLAAMAAMAAGGAAQAQYKVVGPDGRITYSDRPVPSDAGRVSTLSASRKLPTSPLPPELREAAARFPVTLYTAPDCAPCDEGRTLLKSRGVPYAERTASNGADREAWVKQLGANTAPALRIGAKTLLGLTPEDWNSYLDAAGYPRRSALPADYVAAAPEPLTPRVPPTAAPPAPTPAAPPEAAPPSPGGIRF